MPDTFAITIIFIALSATVAVFIRKRKRDKCLKDFKHDFVTLEETTGEVVSGRLKVENTGLEFVYEVEHKEKGEHDETSYILYKNEYPDIQALVRFHNELNEKNRKDREKELKKTYHPNIFRRFRRKIQNIFKTVRDSFVEMIDMFFGLAKRSTPAGAILTSQDKHVSRMKQELMESVGTAYEPLLEKYIGHKVVMEIIKGEKIFKYVGVLKEYTADFIEIMDVDYRVKEGQAARKADLVVQRKLGLVRHFGEESRKKKRGRTR